MIVEGRPEEWRIGYRCIVARIDGQAIVLEPMRQSRSAIVGQGTNSWVDWRSARSDEITVGITNPWGEACAAIISANQVVSECNKCAVEVRTGVRGGIEANNTIPDLDHTGAAIANSTAVSR